MGLELILSRLPDARRSGSGWIAKCPAHQDRRPSLSISEGSGGRVLLHCHAGCPVAAIVEAIGLTMQDLMPEATVTQFRVARSKTPIVSPSRVSRVFKTAREAVESLEKKHGPRSGIWTYCDIDNQPVGAVVRWDVADGKTVRPVAHNGDGWVIGAMPEPRPLYRLPALLDTQRVFVCEGEKAVNAIRGLGLVATTSAGGSQSPHKTDWQPLAGKDVVILPDNDDPGQHYAAEVLTLLAKLLPAPVVRVVNLPDLPDKGDAVEYIAARQAAGLDADGIRAELETMTDATEPERIEPPTPKMDTPRRFPVDVLPEPVKSFVKGASKAIGCDPSYAALPLLSALAACVGNTRRIQLKRTWTEPAILWTAIVGESGTLKSPPFRLAMKSIRKRQGEALKRHTAALEDYRIECARHEKSFAEWRKRKDNSEPPTPPEQPKAERLIVSDVTVEAIATILLDNPRGLLLTRDELAGWVGSFDRYAGGPGGADAAHWLQMHNADPLTVDRKTGQPRTIYVPAASVSVTGTIQPATLERVISQEYREAGLLARILLAMPVPLPKRWTEAEIHPSLESRIGTIVDRLCGLQFNHDEEGEPVPVVVPLSVKGKAAWIDFYNEHANEQIELTGDLAAAWSKLEAYAARLALIVHFIRWAADDPSLHDPEAIDAESVSAGVTLVRWFGSEAKRIYGLFDESDEDREQRRFLELIQRKGGSVTVRNWQRTRHITAQDAEAELTALATAGYGRLDWQEQTGRGQPVKRFVASNVGDSDTNAPGAIENGNTVTVASVTDDEIEYRHEW